MRILVVGASGTLGRPVVQALSLVHDVVAASRSSAVSGRHRRSRLDQGDVRRARRWSTPWSASPAARPTGPLTELTDADFARSLQSKLMGQVNLLRFGLGNLNDDGSVTLTAGIARPLPRAGQRARAAW